MPKYCRNCGTELAEGEKFCSNCGAPAANTPSEDTSSKAPARGGVDWKQLVPKVSLGKAQIHVNKKALIAFAVFIVIVLIAALFK